ncbi:MAG: hypothetical protein ACT4PN_14525, partial [Nitrospiraceae bacterium]
MDSLWPWVKCRVSVATATFLLASVGIISSSATERSYAGDPAPPSGVAAADIDYTGRIAVNGESTTATISTPSKQGSVTFEGTAGQRINIGFSGVTLTQFRVLVYGPDGTAVATQPS